MASLSTHVLDGSAGRAQAGVEIHVYDEQGRLIAGATTGADGRVPVLAQELPLGVYRIAWHTGGVFISAVSVTVTVTEDRHYHVPLLSTPSSTVVYLGA